MELLPQRELVDRYGIIAVEVRWGRSWLDSVNVTAYPVGSDVNSDSVGRKEAQTMNNNRAPTLRELAKIIEANLPGHTAKIERSWSNTDRKIGRLRIKGRGRNGTRITVFHPSGEEVYCFDNSETYRCNQEAAAWVKQAYAVLQARRGQVLELRCSFGIGEEGNHVRDGEDVTFMGANGAKYRLKTKQGRVVEVGPKDFYKLRPRQMNERNTLKCLEAQTC